MVVNPITFGIILSCTQTIISDMLSVGSPVYFHINLSNLSVCKASLNLIATPPFCGHVTMYGDTTTKKLVLLKIMKQLINAHHPKKFNLFMCSRIQ